MRNIESNRIRGELVFILIRHGRTDWNIQRRFCGWADVPLNLEGLAQAEKLSVLTSQLDGLYSSPLSRAKQTASSIGEPILVDGLKELNQGVVEGLQDGVVRETFPTVYEGWKNAPDSVQFPQGESLSICQDRVWRAVEEIASLHNPGDVVGVVSHQVSIGLILCRINGTSRDDWRKYALKNTCGWIVCFSPQGWSVRPNVWSVETGLADSTRG